MRRLVLVLLLAACGGAQRPAPVDAAAPVAHDDPPPLPSDRALAADATFGDLVRAAVHQDDRRASDSDTACLLRASASGFVLEADLSVAVRGLADPANDLGVRVEASHGPVRVLTRLGSYGAASPMVAVALTTIAGASPRTGALLVQTQRGVYLLRTDVDGDVRLRTIETAVADVVSLDVASVFVTADANVPLIDFAHLLSALPDALEGRVAIAAMLPADAVAPDDASATQAPDTTLCPTGLPEIADDVAIGDLDTAALRGALPSLASAAQACVATSASGLGGLVRVAFRIDLTGHVQTACVRQDATGDATLRDCLVAGLQTLSFPAPTGGVVDVELPLRLTLEADAAHRQRPLCR